jgi:hypothetical protein
MLLRFDCELVCYDILVVLTSPLQSVRSHSCVSSCYHLFVTLFHDLVSTPAPSAPFALTIKTCFDHLLQQPFIGFVRRRVYQEAYRNKSLLICTKKASPGGIVARNTFFKTGR